MQAVENELAQTYCQATLASTDTTTGFDASSNSAWTSVDAVPFDGEVDLSVGAAGHSKCLATFILFALYRFAVEP